MRYLHKTFYSCLIVLTLTIPAKLQAQVVENTINLYGQNFPQEKIHIHFDKEAYLPGETIWFKAYIFEDDLPSTRSTNFYTSLYDESGKVVQQLLCPIFNGTADGHFQLPDSLPNKQLICRAYTTWMLNFDTAFLYSRAIRLINNDAKTDNSKTVKQVSLQFFPEGGDIIEGTKNTIAFKANYNNGLPFGISGVIKKQGTNEEVLPVQSVHDGMGRFDIEVAPGEKFYMEWVDDKGNRQQTNLPQAKNTGVSLKLVQVKNNMVFNLYNKLPADSLHVLMYMYQKVFYKTDIAVPASESYTGTVPVNTLPAGIMQLTVFDAQWQPVAERVAFINSNKNLLNASINNKESSTAKRGKNIIEIEVGDTIPSNMSLSVTDADLNSDVAGSTIVSDLLLSGDVKGFINNPAYYFTTAPDAKQGLDLVMLTHGWRKYNWDDMRAAKMPVINFPPDNYLSVYGQISKTAMQKLDTAELVNLIVKTKDSTQRFYFARPDANGLVKQTGLVFYDTAKVLFSFNKNKLLNPQMAFGNTNYTLRQPVVINNAAGYLIPDTAGYVMFNQAASKFGYYIKENSIKQFNKEKTMQGVVVKNGGWHNWKNDQMTKLDEKYSNMFRGVGATVWAFDVMHDEMAPAKMDIYNYMIGKIPGVKVNFKDGYKRFDPPLLIFVDENEIDEQVLWTVNYDNIAYIKYYEHTPWRQFLPPSICIYMKKGDDLIDRRPKDTDLKSVKVSGYSPIKEFYSPDYSQNNTGTDARTTLLWLPYIITDATLHKIPVTFYNNDFTKKIRITLEGINDEGKLVHLEKVIE